MQGVGIFTEITVHTRVNGVGDSCISYSGDCKCGNEIFGPEDQKWCCNNNTCTGNRCTGRALNLTEACDQKCKYYGDDSKRNFRGIRGSFMPCSVSHVKTTECVQEDKVRDGKYDCRNRADEEAFQTHIGNSSSLLLNLDKILTPCKFKVSRFQSFKCTGVNIDGDCLHMTGMVQFW